MNLNNSLVISFGLEVHITVQSQKKIFNWENTYRGDTPPNSQVGAWELGHLGVLPIINPEVIKLGLKLAAALAMKINPLVLFDRKIYNYFDLPKGYQITQQDNPLAIGGYLPIVYENQLEKIPLKSIHLEEDTAKSVYDKEEIKLDFNRAGNPLIELVTEPVFSEVEKVLVFIKQLQNLCRYLDISSAKMEQGQLRVDLNFSLRIGQDYSTPRYEIKNLNSLTNIEKAVRYEIVKHQKIFQQGEKPPISQTLGFNEIRQITVSQRKKTNYFYLPEVNIPPIKFSSQEIKKIAQSVPRLPWEEWEFLEGNGVDNSRTGLVLEKPFLLKTLVFLEKKPQFSSSLVESWISFFLNYLNSIFSHDNFSLFCKRWKSYWQLFQLAKNKELETQEVREITIQLTNTKKSLSSLIKKYQKKDEIDRTLIYSILEKLWDSNLAHKYLAKPQPVRNFLCGQIKKNFANLDIKKISLLINDFIEEKCQT
jgi:aspartyl-tRNA(Asn)/glutamyl-tRNA(Gln) amidotransferase subunit B